MAIQLSVDVRNARLDAIEVTTGVSAVLKVFSGSQPANCAADDSGTALSTVDLPADWMADASNGSKSKSGTWQELSADHDGTAGYFRVYSSGGVCKMQGSVTKTGNGGDMTVDNTSLAAGQQFTVVTFTLTDANA